MNGQRPVIVVTGASRRVGRALALELARSGCDLILSYHTRRESCEETRALAIEASAGQANVAMHPLDLDDLTSVDAFTTDLRKHARIDALVHNASSYSPSPFGSITVEDAMHHYRANALAPLLITQAVADHLRASPLEGGGAVIFFGDIHTLGRPRLNYAPYAMSKSALVGLIESLALDLAPRVRVNGIAPGVVAWPDHTDAAHKAAYEAKIPLGRPGIPEDAAKLARWLILEATYITGEMIRLDGGRWLR